MGLLLKSKRTVLLALTINKQYFVRGVVRYAREHDWYLVTDMMYTGRLPLGWRGDGILMTRKCLWARWAPVMPDGADGLAAIASFLGQFPTLLSGLPCLLAPTNPSVSNFISIESE